jgi:putative transposase|tara:strand:- start:48 stop:1274 length:1227 start_codon:yes stop_codon:yes gene_type:complete
MIIRISEVEISILCGGDQMSKRQKEHTRPNLSAQVRSAILGTMETHLPLGIQGRDLDDEKVWDILVYSSVNGTTIEGACNELADSPSGTTVRTHLGEALRPTRETVVGLDEQLTQALQSQVPKALFRRLDKRAYEIGMDLVEIPYHGQPAEDEDEIRRGKAKSGTTHFHAYATLSVVHHRQRYELALTFVWKNESMGQVVQRLVAQARRLGIRIRRAYLDKGFCGEEVFLLLRRRRIPYLIPIPRKGKSGGIRSLFVGRKSYRSVYTFNAGKDNAYTTDVILICRYYKGRYGRHGIEWFPYAAWGMNHIPNHQIFDLYRRRFGMETGYRQMHQTRARTTSRNPALRLVLVGLALLICNVYIHFRRICHTKRAYGQRTRRIWLSLKRMTLMLHRAIEQLLGITPIEKPT